MRFFLPLFAITLLLSGCSEKGSDTEKDDSESPKDSTKAVVSDRTKLSQPAIPFDELTASILKDPTIDLELDVTGYTFTQLRILWNLIPARQGYLFMESDLRAWFNQTEWYTEVMENRWYGECEESGYEKMPAISYSEEEESFMNRCKERAAELKKENYIASENGRVPNMENVVNLWQFSDLDPKLREHLESDGFVIASGNNVQFFHLYEENDYSQTQNFVTTDMVLQLMHVHTSFLVRNIEEGELSNTLKSMLKAANNKLKNLGNEHPELKDQTDYLQSFMAVAMELNDLMPAYPSPEYKQLAQQEVSKIRSLSDDVSAILPTYRKRKFPYSMFKPRGHYTRSDILKTYFMTMQWIQWASFCAEENDELQVAMILAQVMEDPTVAAHYDKMMDITQFFFGEPDNLSIRELHAIMKKNGAGTIAALTDDQVIGKVKKAAMAAIGEKNKISPDVANGCSSFINFMPARYMFDNEVLQKLAWIDPDGNPTKRPHPKGLDVFAAMGIDKAEDILINEYNEGKNWAEYVPRLKELQDQFSGTMNWNVSVYNKTMEVLKYVHASDKRHPSFMKTGAWARKNLNTSLASWAELKHDAVLYAEQPFAAECGGGGMCAPPPEPIVRSYVEPNVKMYEKLLELLNLTKENLGDMEFYANGWESNTDQLIELVEFVNSVAEKQLNGESVTKEEHARLEIIGSTVEYLTLQLMDQWEWESIQGADREVALVADVYTNNWDREQAGILHVATGNVNDIYVIVEIRGTLYLTRGGVFSYHEFVKPTDQRLTDEEWQNELKKGEPKTLPWMNPIYVPKELKPQVDHTSYSSGC